MMVGLAMAAAGMLLLTTIGQDTAYWSHVLPAELLMSVGLAGGVHPGLFSVLLAR